jgi:GDPmannose 4,6-dehydratase
MLQQDKPEDFVLATGEMHYVREFVEKAFRVLGVEIQLATSLECSTTWFTKTLSSVAGLERVLMKSGPTLKLAKLWSESIPSTSVLLKSSKYQQFSLTTLLNSTRLLRRQLLGRPTKAERLLGWRRNVNFDSLVKEMVEADLNASRSLVEDHN